MEAKMEGFKMMNKKLKKATVAVAALSLAVSGVPTTIFPQNVAVVNASVDDEVFESGDFRYKVTDNNTKVSILGFTESAKEKTTVAIPTTVNYDDYDFPVAAIEEKAFKGNTAITSIVFTDKDGNVTNQTNLSKIGKSAFEGCTGLTTVTLAEGVKALGGGTFKACTNLTTVNLPSTITEVVDTGIYGNGPFIECTGLQKVTFAEGTTTIPNNIFGNCDFITAESFNMPATVTTIGKEAFKGTTKLESIELSKDLKTIGRSAFEGCSGLKNIVLPASLTTMGSNSFEGCELLTEVTIPKSVENVDANIYGNSPFTNCKNLKKVVFEDGMEIVPAHILDGAKSVKEVSIPDTVTAIEKSAFKDVAQLKTVTLPKQLKSIGIDAFSGCNALISITFPGTLTTIGSNSFEACNRLTEVTIPKSVTGVAVNIYENSPFTNCENLKKVVFEEGTQVVPAYILNGAKSVKEVSIPDTVTSIERSAFAECNALENVKLPKNLTTIANNSFKACNRLAEITIPKTVTKVETNIYGNSPFNECENLKKVVFEDGMEEIPAYILADANSVAAVCIPASVTKIQDKAFDGIKDKITIYGYANTYAETYAKENNIPFALYGEAPVITTPTPVVPATTAPVQTSEVPATTAPVQTSEVPATTAPVQTPEVTATTAPTQTPAVAVKAPKKATVTLVKRNSAKKATVKWKKIAGVAGYQVTYSTKSNFKGAKTKNVASSKNSYVITGLKKGKVYYVKVRAYKKNSAGKKIVGAYSTVKKIKK